MRRLFKLAARFEAKLSKIAKTIYHGTSINRAKEIEKSDLIPQVGPWVQEMYGPSYDLSGEEYEEMGEQSPIFELVFGADKKAIDMAIGGMVATISSELDKDYQEVTDEDIYNYGALVVVKEGEEYFQQRPPKDAPEKAEEDWHYYEEGGRYPTVEPGDYYSTESVPVSYILTGAAMIRMLKRAGEWPRDWGPNAAMNKRKMLIEMAIKQHNAPYEVVSRVSGLSDDEVDRFYQQYKE